MALFLRSFDMGQNLIVLGDLILKEVVMQRLVWNHIRLFSGTLFLLSGDLNHITSNMKDQRHLNCMASYMLGEERSPWDEVLDYNSCFLSFAYC